MLAGELYDPMDAELVAARTRARELCQALNATRETDREGRRALPGRLSLQWTLRYTPTTCPRIIVDRNCVRWT